MTSELSSPKKPLTNSHHRRHGTMSLTLHLALSSLTPGHSPCPLQNRRSLTMSSTRTLQTAASIHPSPLWAPMFFIKKKDGSLCQASQPILSSLIRHAHCSYAGCLIGSKWPLYTCSMHA